MKFILLLVSFVISSYAFAWGPKGQQITVKVAEAYLTPSAKNKIAVILSGQSLSSFATWADQVRSTPEWSHTSTWHYVDVADAKIQDQNVMTAIDNAFEILTSSAENSEKEIWLKFLIHFVGDLHQPMHVGRPDDRGGNSTKVSYDGKNINLHALWDSSFIEKQGLDVDKFVVKLISQNRSMQYLTEEFDSQIVVDENLALRDFLYSFKGNKIDKVYEREAIKVTDDKLWMGGLRLASILNSVFR